MTSTTDSPVIMFDSDEAARYATNIEGWVSRDGFFYGKDGERSARYAGCTHVACDGCGAPARKGFIKCDPCMKRGRDEKYASFPLRETWTDFVCVFDDDTYFSDEEEAIEYCEDRDIDPSSLQLVACEPVMPWEVEPADEYADEIPEDGEVPAEIADAFAVLNEAIRKCKTPLCWRPIDVRVNPPSEGGNA